MGTHKFALSTQSRTKQTESDKGTREREREREMTKSTAGLLCNRGLPHRVSVAGTTTSNRRSSTCRPHHVVVAFAKGERKTEGSTVQLSGRREEQAKVAMPENVKKMLVAAAAGILLTSTALPEESWAARSGGRVGGRAFRSAPRSAPRTSSRMGRSGGTYTAPPLVGGYGRGYGGYGYGFPVFAPPIFFFNPLGSIFQLFLLLAAVQFVMGVTKNITTQKGFMDDDDDKDIFD